MTANVEQAPDQIRETVREKYAESARRVAESSGACCGPSCCRSESFDPVTSNRYTSEDVAAVPQAAISASLGCGNPTALAQLNPGEKVLDLGSGGGIDVLLSARRVGPTGFAYGLDDRLTALETGAQRSQPPLEAGGKVDVRVGGDTCHR